MATVLEALDVDGRSKPHSEGRESYPSFLVGIGSPDPGHERFCAYMSGDLKLGPVPRLPARSGVDLEKFPGLGRSVGAVAGRGPAPKDPSERRRRNEDAIPQTVVQADGLLRGPELPDGGDWPSTTRMWWKTWRESPQASTFTETDWVFLLDTALLHAAFWSGDRTVAGELRLRVAKFGATPEDRARLRISVAPSEKAPRRSAKPASQSRRDRVLKVVGDDE